MGQLRVSQLQHALSAVLSHLMDGKRYNSL
jgi:hypothetical protein